MKRLFSQITLTRIKSALLVLAALVLATQSSATVLAVSPVANNYLAVSTKNELNRRTGIMTADKKLVQDAGAGSVSSAMLEMVNAVLHTIDARKQSLNTAATVSEVKTIASNVDSDFAEFRSVDLSVKLYADLKAQDKSVQQLRSLAQQIQNSVNAAKANGATHVNAGVAGFVLLDLINNNVDKLKKSLTAGAITTVALNGAISLLTDSDYIVDSTSASALTQLYDQLTVTQDMLKNVALGLSQLSNVVTGNRTGVSYCGFWSNCQGNENNGVVQVCGVAFSTCKDNTNNGGVQVCGYVLSLCQDNTNNGNTQTCGSLSNCQNNTNDGVSQKCGLASNCKDNVNNGLFVNCGSLSVCAGNTNNGGTQNCGLLSNCKDNTNNGLTQTCGSLANCQNNTNNGLSQNCGLLSNCQNYVNNGISQDCGTLSNCSNSVNNGVAVSCGIASNCSKSINNGGVIKCGDLSNCSGATNNGLLLVCGTLSNCSGTTTSGFTSVCGSDPTCSSGTSSSFITICGDLANCSTTIKPCTVDSNGQPVTASANTLAPLRFGINSISA